MNILSNSTWRYINISYFFLIRKIIRQKKATHLILEHPYYGWLGILLKWSCGIRLIVHSHNLEGLRWKTLGKWWWKILWNYERLTHRRADYNFFIHDQDKQYAIDHFRLLPGKCLTMTYGIDRRQIPPAPEIQLAQEEVRARHRIPAGKKILLFNGAFQYAPNLDGLKRIVDTINPLLQKKDDFNYVMIICGINIPEQFSAVSYPDIVIAGFVEDISLYFKGADVFINPINEGGGIKTKLVEALGNNLNAVSTENGAVGIDPAWCNHKLQVCGNEDWPSFAAQIVQACSYTGDIPDTFYEHFYWGYTTKKAAAFIELTGESGRSPT
jgi:glycosyltransferase involved in cell wall biosynthesis